VYTALKIINILIPSYNARKYLSTMSNDEITRKIETIKRDIQHSGIAILDSESTEAKALEREYESYYLSSLFEHQNYTQLPSNIQGVKEPPATKPILEYKLDRLYGSKINPPQQAKLFCDRLARAIMEKTDDEDWEPLDVGLELAKAEEKLTGIYSQAFRLRKLIESGSIEEAKELLDSIQGKPKQRVDKVSDKPDLIPISVYIKEFLEAGVEGKLSPVKGEKRAAWTPKTLRDNEYIGKVVSLHLGSIPLNKIRGKELDDLFREAVVNMPLGNIKPFNRMTIEERYNAAIEGYVDDDSNISGKTISGYKKLLQSFFSHVLDGHLLDGSPLDEMRYKISGGKGVRGAFTLEQAKQIVAYCNEQSDFNKRWPVILMAYTGMRNGEIMQLRREDILEDEGYPYILVTDKNGKVKTRDSVRRVPIHSSLIEMGFMEFVTESGDKLFSKDSKFLTRFYANNIKPDLSIADETDYNKTLSLYSLRHFVITELTSKGVNETTTQQIVGHSKKQNTMNRFYMDAIALPALSKAIELIKLD
jgi:integrase